MVRRVLYCTGALFDLKTAKFRHFVFGTWTRTVRFSDAPDSTGRLFLPSSQEYSERWEAAQTRVQTHPESYWKLYKQYRHGWPNYILAALIILGECGIGIWLRRVWKVNRIQSCSG